jgi:hypothetical protein
MKGFPRLFSAHQPTLRHRGWICLLLIFWAGTAAASPQGKPALEFKRKVKELYQFAKEMEKSGAHPEQTITVKIPGTVYDPPRRVPVIQRANATYDTPGQALISWLNANLARDPEWRKEAIHPSEVGTLRGDSESVNEGSEFAIQGAAEFHDIFIFFLTHKCKYSTGGLLYALVVKSDNGYRFTRAAYKLDRPETIKLFDVISKNYTLYEDTRGKLFASFLEPEPEPEVVETAASVSIVVKGVNSQGFPVVILTNNEARDIDNIMAGASICDADGNVLFSTGLTDWVTGSVFLKAGESKETSLYITLDAQDRNPEGKRLLNESPQTLTGKFDVKRVTFIRK